MKTLIKTMIMIVALLSCRLYSQPIGSPPPTPSQEEPEVLNQGPIHEAFAQPVDLTPQTGIISPSEPPAGIIENPDSEKPKGPEYIWIPGYWGWDSDRQGYIWISGCWRRPPVNMSWIPGYWSKVGNGWQWVAGFWISRSQTSQIEYLPQPPEVVNIEQPVVTNGNSIWVPACYYWHNNQYILRPGYWLAPQENWIWVPSHYTWTPYGYVFVTGYWDTVLATRGILYAPVYFPSHFHRPIGYSYSLSMVVDIGNLQFSLFSYPHYCHYYFGDYYNNSYISLGIYPWFEVETRHGWYDPIFVHDRWHYRDTPNWSGHIHHEYDLRRADINMRPPRTYRQIETRFSGSNGRHEFQMVRPIHNYSESKNTPFTFYRMNDKEHNGTIGRTNQVNDFRKERMHIESGSVISKTTPQSRGLSIPQQQPSTHSIPQERTMSGRPTVPGTQSQPKDFSARSFSESRTFSEKKYIPQSPVTDRSSSGIIDHRTPSRPEKERGFEQDKTRPSQDSRGHR